MNKNKIIEELTNVLSVALRHKIGSIVNSNEIYAQKYAKDYEILLNEAKNISLLMNWNLYDRTEIKQQLKRKLKNELEKKYFLKHEKFNLMDKEIEIVLTEMDLNHD